jgi:hypothetical protein
MTDLALRRRGQVLPVFAIGLAILAAVTIWFFNNVMLRTSAGVAMDSALRAATVAAVHQIDLSYGYERWYIDHTAGESTAREFVIETLVGAPGISAGSYASLFVGELEAILLDQDGTAGGTQVGLDVEVINPAQDDSQDSDRSFNGVIDVSPTLCGDPDEYPHYVESTINGSCYAVATVVVELRLDAIQLAGGQTGVERISVGRAGTDD